MRLAKAGYAVTAAGVFCFLAVRWTHSGIGSCGPYGPAGSAVFFGIVLLPIGLILMAVHWIGRAIAHFRD